MDAPFFLFVYKILASYAFTLSDFRSCLACNVFIANLAIGCATNSSIQNAIPKFLGQM